MIARGARLAVLIKPTDALSITPRIVYQNLTTNGFPRGTCTTFSPTPTRPWRRSPSAACSSTRSSVKGLLDQFTLGDLKIDYAFGPATLTSITSYTDRKVRVLRDATQLTGSVTFDILGNADPNIQQDVRINSPLYDRTALNALSEEIRLASSNSTTVSGWWAGSSSTSIATTARTCRLPGMTLLSGCRAWLFNAPPDTPFYSDLRYTLKQYAGFGEATWHITQQWATHRRSALLQVRRGQGSAVRRPVCG